MQTYCTGAARVWVAFPTSYNYYSGATFGPPEPFGTCERAPRPRIIRQWEDIFNDLGGTKIPFDRMYQGQIGMVGGTMTRWRERVATALAATPSQQGLGTTPGTDVLGDVGAIMGLEGFTYQVWVEYIYGTSLVNKAAMVLGQMPDGFHFFASIYEGPDDHSVGTGPKKLDFTFYGLRRYMTQTGDFDLYDFDMSAIAGLAWEVNP